MKRLSAKLLVPLALTCAILSGCASGASSGSTSAPSATSTASASASATNSGAPIKIAFTWWGTQPRHDYTQQLTDLYTKENPNVTFENIPLGWDGYFDKLSTEAASGTMPDLIQMDYLYIDTYAANGTLTDMQPYIDDGTIDTSSWDKDLLNSGIVNGKMVAMVLSSSVLAFPYNPTVLQNAGLSDPSPTWTWTDFMNDCLQVQSKTGKMGFASLPIDTNILSYWVRQSGSPLFSADDKSLGYSDDSVFVNFCEMYQKLVQAKAAPNPDQWMQISSLAQNASPVVTGDAAFTQNWCNFDVSVESANANLKLALPPQPDSSSGTATALWMKPGMFFSVAKTSKNPEACAQFINWFTNSQEANDIIMAERGVPVSSTIRDYLKPKVDAQTQAEFDYVSNAATYCGSVPAPDPQGISEINTLLVDTINKVLYGQLSPQDAATTFRSQANAILVRNNSGSSAS